MATSRRITDIELGELGSSSSLPQVRSSALLDTTNITQQSRVSATSNVDRNQHASGSALPPCHARMVSLSLFSQSRFSFLRKLLPSKEQSQTLLSERIFQEAKQGIFICLTKPDSGSYAIQIKCSRPSGVRVPAVRRIREKKSEVIRYRRVENDSPALECDSDIYERIRYAFYTDQGWWKKFIPYFGIINVEEVTVRHCLTYIYSETYSPTVPTQDQNFI
jgi:hypothetical protein